jgi:putative phosphoribosyl transferase
MRFKDRTDAGQQLAKKLLHYKNAPNTIVLGLPRGGVVTAYEISKVLELPLDIIVARKIGAPGNEELAIGALTEGGTTIFNHGLMESLGLTIYDLMPIIEKEKKEADRRFKLYRSGRGPLELKDKTVILVDDGIATGATMRAAIHSARTRGAKKIIVAVPVAPPGAIAKLKKEADEVICLYETDQFWGVGQFYDNFGQTSDDEVIEIMNKARQV